MRKFFVLLALGLMTAGLLATSGSAMTTSKGSAAKKSAHATSCATQLPSREGRFAGIVSAQSIQSSCSASTPPPYNGAPPLLYWGGPVMGAGATITVTPIYWEPGGQTANQPGYSNLISQYLSDVAAAGGTSNDGSNVYSTLSEYYDQTYTNNQPHNHYIKYKIKAGTPIVDIHPLPASSCTVMHRDQSNIYADGSGYYACIDDAQVNAEINAVLAGHNLKVDLNHIYVLYTPKGVESCFGPGKTANASNVCTINHYKSAGYCAYHGYDPSTGLVYANMPYAIYASPVGYTCGSDAGGYLGGLQFPNGQANADADTEISPTSHELMESFTDPYLNSWYDYYGYENGDECAYIWGPTTAGANPGEQYNQTINGHHYLTQEEFSNADFFGAFPTGGCVQGESGVTAP